MHKWLLWAGWGIFTALVAGCFAAVFGPARLLADERTTSSAKPAKVSDGMAEVVAVDGPLARYIRKPDDSFAWNVRRTGTVGKTSYVELTLTSQTWRDIPWKHQLFIMRPSQVNHAQDALLVIAGGRWDDSYAGPPAENERLPREATLLANAAELLQAPVAVLRQVPEQPILGGLFEDAAIAYTFDQYLRSGEEDWPLLLPMVKSAVKGMDAVQQYARQHWDLDVRRFTVTGASKRGWTTWLTAAVDPRVAALAPMVIDVLNMPRQMQHQLATWGQFSAMIADYTRRNIPQRALTEAGKTLNAIVDPYSYREHLRQPKLILLGTNDPYWPLDALNLYWDGLTGDKYVVYVPNAGHGLDGVEGLARVLGGVVALHQSAQGRRTLPQLEWKMVEEDGALTIHVRSDQKPQQVTLWSTTSDTRDFRQAKWTSQPAEANGDGYIARLPVPETGFAAGFVELTYGGSLPLFLSTNVQIVEGRSE